MDANIQNILKELSLLSADWHHAGTMSDLVLNAIAVHAERLGKVRYSSETGSGKTTLLFSHLSENHEVFAVNDGESISRVKGSSLFNAKNVTYVEGPSQLTLPRHVFKAKSQITLIDGPHAYPFPDLEYYYFYPQISPGGLLLIDDINIPSIERMCAIIKSDDMFELLEVVEYTAFFRRTTAPLLNPVGDDWGLQGFNRAHYQYFMAREQSSSALRRITHLIPLPLKKFIPLRWKTKMLNKL